MERLMTLFSSIGEGLTHCELVFDANGKPHDYKIIAVNDSFEKISGLSEENIIGRNFLELFPQVESEWIDVCAKVAITGIPSVYEFYFRPLLKHVNAIVFSDKKLQFYVLYIDITEIKDSIENNVKYKLLFDNSSDVIFFLNENGDIIEANKSAVKAYGYNAEEFRKLKVTDIRSPDSLKYISRQFDAAISGGIVFETNHIKKDGTVFPVEVSSNGTQVGNQKLIMSIVRDISERRDYENDLIHLANHDYLTKIFNRNYVFSILPQMCREAIARHKKLAVIFFDIDKFKVINDTYGHEMGDVVLKDIVKRINRVIDDKDVFGRIGGDEFVVIQPYIKDYDDIYNKVQSIISEFEKPFVRNNLQIVMSTSIGVSSFPDDSTDIDELMIFADRAMYEAKKVCGNTYMYYFSIK